MVKSYGNIDQRINVVGFIVDELDFMVWNEKFYRIEMKRST